MKYLSIIILILISLSAKSQLVNVETKRKSLKEGLQGFVSLSANFTKNTKEIWQAKNIISLQYKKKAHLVLLLNDISFMKVDEGDLINTGFQHFRYNYTFKDTSFLTLEAFVQHQYNKVKSLKTRIIAGGGPRFKITDKSYGKFYLYICPLVMYEYEYLTEDIKNLKNPNDKETNVLKGDFYVSIGYEINKTFSISNVTYYQPDLSNWSDYRISCDTGLKLKFTDKLALTIIYSLDYDSKPPTFTDDSEIQQLQYPMYYVRNTLSYSF